MLGERGRGSFHFEITSLEDFLLFCAIIRGADADAATLDALVARLKAANNDQAQVVAANTPATS